MGKNIEEIIRIRRAVYPNMFTGKKIDKKIIEKALENSNFAPSHKLTQPWLFKIFSGVSKKKLAEKMTDLYKKDVNILKYRTENVYKKCEKSDYIICICNESGTKDFVVY